jgi:hypothetical protein
VTARPVIYGLMLGRPAPEGWRHREQASKRRQDVPSDGDQEEQW